MNKVEKEGNLREYLRNNYQKLKLYNRYGRNSKLVLLKQISQGLKDIHRKQLVHRDFHSGNIIVDKNVFRGDKCHITDLGLAKPVNETDNNQVYGLMPYVAPEVLRNQPYTQASDIYSLGIVMYELITGYPPFTQSTHDINLALQICRGERPQFPEQVKYPPILVNLITSCWDQDPNNRPTAREISSIVGGWFHEDILWDLDLKEDTEFYHQLKEAEEFNATLPEEIKYPAHQSQKVWHSKPINTQQIAELSQSQVLDLDDDGDSIGIQSSSLANQSTGLTKLLKRQLSLGTQTTINQGATKTQKLDNELVEEPMEIELQAQIQLPPKKYP